MTGILKKEKEERDENKQKFNRSFFFLSNEYIVNNWTVDSPNENKIDQRQFIIRLKLVKESAQVPLSIVAVGSCDADRCSD